MPAQRPIGESQTTNSLGVEAPVGFVRITCRCAKVRFRLTQFTPGNFEDRDFFIEWPIRVGLDGTYHELGLFFDRLSRFSRIINVTELTIAPIKRNEGNLTIHADFVKRTYIYKEETPPPEAQP